jgi:hypothetical protein
MCRHSIGQVNWGFVRQPEGWHGYEFRIAPSGAGLRRQRFSAKYYSLLRMREI